MSDESNDKPQTNETESQAHDRRAAEDFRDGMKSLFSAARKVIKGAEPTVTNALDDAERVLEKVGRGGTHVAGEVGKEVATLATRLADKLKAVANRIDGNVPDERTPPDPGNAGDESNKP